MTAQSELHHTAPAKSRNLRTGLTLFAMFAAMLVGSVIYIMLYH